MVMEISKTISVFESTKWSWKVPRPFYLQAQIVIFFVGGGVENDHGHFCMFAVLEI